jgi:ABC-type antimicrobial peptide transport system permease subunit
MSSQYRSSSALRPERDDRYSFILENIEKFGALKAIVTFRNIGLALGMVIVIAAISSYFGIRRVLRIEPFDIFRG